MEHLVISLIFSGITAALLTLLSLRMLQVYQLSSYQADGFFRWLKRTNGDYLLRYFALTFFQFISLLLFNFGFSDSYFKYLGMALYIALGIYFLFLEKKGPQKTPLKVTKRIIRQLVLLPIIYFSLGFVAIYFTKELALGYSLLAIISLLIPVCVTISHFLLLPLEKAIHAYYYKKAAKALQSDIIKVGITGSYGKTTAKKILTDFLSKKYKVLASPGSYNTPMGLAKLVNSGIHGYDVFIAEMGARHKGEIKQLCQMISPDYGIITATGVQHLETFGSIDAIIKTKLELASGTKGFVAINSDDQRLMGTAANNKQGRLLYAGSSGADAAFSDVEVGKDGTSFNLIIGQEKIYIQTPLLGRHIPSMITQCALIAVKMGVSLTQIKESAAVLTPVEHRLQLITTKHGTVIDDAYNSNPQGAKNALEVLAMFEGTKVVITPGFIELGERQIIENKNLGESIADSADYLISVSSKEIAGGAQIAGMADDRIFIEDSLDQAMSRLNSLELTSPVILFLNDLPDIY